MLEDLLNNRQHILICIQYEVIRWKSVDFAYSSFCRALGENVIEFLEFDFWFHHFLNGHFDLDHDRSKDPIKPQLKDMPVDIVKKIVEKLSFEDRTLVRKVSHSLRDVIDNSKQDYKEISLNITSNRTALYIDERKIWYYQQNDGSVAVVAINYEEFDVQNANHLEMALNDMAIVLKNPKATVDKLFIQFHDSLNQEDKAKAIKALNEAFSHLNHKIPAKSLCFKSDYLDGALSVLPYLQSGILEKIELDCYASDPLDSDSEESDNDSWISEPFSDNSKYSELEDFFQPRRHRRQLNRRISKTCVDIDEIVKLDQWRQAKTILFVNIMAELPNMDKLKEALLCSPNLKLCKINFTREYEPSEAQAIFGTGRISNPGSSDGSIYINYGFDFIEFNKA